MLELDEKKKLLGWRLLELPNRIIMDISAISLYFYPSSSFFPLQAPRQLAKPHPSSASASGGGNEVRNSWTHPKWPRFQCTAV